MSKTSYFLIGVIITALLFMGAVRGYEFYERKAAQWEAEREAEASVFSFQNVPLTLAPPTPEPPSRPVLFVPQQEKEIFLGEEPLSTEMQIQQAQETIQSILADYRDNPDLRAFNQDLRNETQGVAVDLSSLSGGDLSVLLRENPQIRDVFVQHMRNPNFVKTVEQILSNPQFAQSVQTLQQTKSSAITKKTAK